MSFVVMHSDPDVTARTAARDTTEMISPSIPFCGCEGFLCERVLGEL